MVSLVSWDRKHTPWAEAFFYFALERAKPEGLAYLEADRSEVAGIEQVLRSERLRTVWFSGDSCPAG
jgi:hypothetical protein